MLGYFRKFTFLFGLLDSSLSIFFPKCGLFLNLVTYNYPQEKGDKQGKNKFK